MKNKGIVLEDFVNFKLPSLFIASTICNWKCCLEQHLDTSICQNSSLAQQPAKDIPDSVIYNAYAANSITKAVVIGGLEPMMQFEEIENLIKYFRINGENAPFVIYTGYDKDELQDKISALKLYKNIIIKFGRYVPGQEPHYDKVLGVNLVSHNQYAEVIS